jgi:hypothetical protein
MGGAIVLGLVVGAIPLWVVWSLWSRLNAQLKASNEAETWLWASFLIVVVLCLAPGFVGIPLMIVGVGAAFGPGVAIATLLPVAIALAVTFACLLSDERRGLALMLALQATAAVVSVAGLVFLFMLAYAHMWEDF